MKNTAYAACEIESEDYITLSLRVEMLYKIYEYIKSKNGFDKSKYREYIDFRCSTDDLAFGIFIDYAT